MKEEKKSLWKYELLDAEKRKELISKLVWKVENLMSKNKGFENLTKPLYQIFGEFW